MIVSLTPPELLKILLNPPHQDSQLNESLSLALQPSLKPLAWLVPLTV